MMPPAIGPSESPATGYDVVTILTCLKHDIVLVLEPMS